MKTGFCRLDITPPLGIPIAGYFVKRLASGIIDPIEVCAVAVSDNENTAVFAALDFAGFQEYFAKKVRTLVSKRTGIPQESVFLSSTHTHTGPLMLPDTQTLAFKARSVSNGAQDEAYNDVTVRRIADACVLAVGDLQDAEMSIGVSKLEGFSFIRRYLMKNGQVVTNPGRKAAQNGEIVKPLGQVNPELTVLEFKRQKDRILLTNFAVHADCIGGDKLSADYPGHLRRGLEKIYPDTKALFINGVCGDVNHIDPYDTAENNDGSLAFSYRLAAAIQAAVMKTPLKKVGGDGKVRAGIRPVVVKSREFDAQTEKESFDILKSVIEGTYDGGIMGGGGALGRAYHIGEHGAKSKDITLQVSGIRMGDVSMVGFSGEAFSEVYRLVRAKCPTTYLIGAHHTNGGQGYFPMKSAFSEGGYEQTSSPYSAGVAEALAQGAIELLDKLKD